jgi:hypothetical protein
MPGGHLNYGIYKLLGGERSFGDFWFQIGLPVVAVILGSLFLLVLKLEVLHVNTWVQSSALFVVLVAIAIAARLID